MLIFCDFIQFFKFFTNQHLNVYMADNYDGPNGSFFISILLHNSEFRILNSEFRNLHCEFRNSELSSICSMGKW